VKPHYPLSVSPAFIKSESIPERTAGGKLNEVLNRFPAWPMPSRTVQRLHENGRTEKSGPAPGSPET